MNDLSFLWERLVTGIGIYPKESQGLIMFDCFCWSQCPSLSVVDQTSSSPLVDPPASFPTWLMLRPFALAQLGQKPWRCWSRWPARRFLCCWNRENSCTTRRVPINSPLIVKCNVSETNAVGRSFYFNTHSDSDLLPTKWLYTMSFTIDGYAETYTLGELCFVWLRWEPFNNQREDRWKLWFVACLMLYMLSSGLAFLFPCGCLNTGSSKRCYCYINVHWSNPGFRDV